MENPSSSYHELSFICRPATPSARFSSTGLPAQSLFHSLDSLFHLKVAAVRTTSASWTTLTSGLDLNWPSGVFTLPPLCSFPFFFIERRSAQARTSVLPSVEQISPYPATARVENPPFVYAASPARLRLFPSPFSSELSQVQKDPFTRVC